MSFHNERGIYGDETRSKGGPFNLRGEGPSDSFSYIFYVLTNPSCYNTKCYK